MRYAIDLGGSTIDCVKFDEVGNKILMLQSLESKLFPEKKIEDLITAFEITEEIKKEKHIRITGGKSHFYPDSVYIDKTKVTIERVHEFKALTKGAMMCSGKSIGLAVSLGTGTAMVFYNKNYAEHIKGTGVGGGSFIGLGKALLGISSFEELACLAEQGDPQNINLSVEEIVGGNLGLLSGKATASHFAKYSEKSSRADVARGLASFIAESITALAIEKAMRLKVDHIIIGGKFSRLKILQDHMKSSAQNFGIECVFPKNSEYMTVIGAVIKNN